MGRKKSGAAVADVDADESGESRAARLIKKAFGDGVIVNGSRVVDVAREVTPVSPALDMVLHGGFVSGTLVTMAGPPGCGKTTTALDFAATWQAKGRRVFYVAAEGRIYAMNLAGIRGLDAGKIEVIGSAEGRIMTAEDYLLATEMIIKNEKNALVIVDSFSILSDSGEVMAADYDKSPPVGGSSRLVGRWCRRMTPIIPINNNLVIGMAHVYSNIGGKKKYAVSLPIKMSHLRSTGLVCEYFPPLQKDGDRSAWGQEVHWKCERTPLGSPGGKAVSILRFGRGVDREREMVAIGLELGLASQAGSYYTLDFLGDDAPKFQGMDKVVGYLEENPAVADQLNSAIRDLSFEET